MFSIFWSIFWKKIVFLSLEKLKTLRKIFKIAIRMNWKLSRQGCSYHEVSTPIFISILLIDQFSLILSTYLLEINIVDTSQYDHPCVKVTAHHVGCMCICVGCMHFVSAAPHAMSAASLFILAFPKSLATRNSTQLLWTVHNYFCLVKSGLSDWFYICNNKPHYTVLTSNNEIKIKWRDN